MSFYAHPDGRFYRFDKAKDAPDGFVKVGDRRTDVAAYYQDMEDAGTDAPGASSLDSLTVAELDAIAVDRGIEFTDGMKKADKVAAIEQAS